MKGRCAFSVVIPTLNERDTIAACVEGVRSVDGGAFAEVIVVDGDPAGSTLEVLDDTSAVPVTAPRGRARQMNAGARRATGDVLVFLHADTFLPSTAFVDIESALEDDAVVGGAFAHCFDSTRRIHRVVSAFVSAMTRLNRLPYGDQAIFIRRSYFDAIGGFADIEVMEDQELVRRIRRRGDGIALLGATVRTSPRRLEAEGMWRRIVRNWMMTVMYGLGVPPRRLARHYHPHGES